MSEMFEQGPLSFGDKPWPDLYRPIVTTLVMVILVAIFIL